MNQFIAPTHPGQNIDYVAVTTPEEAWPLTGALPPRLARVRAPEHLAGLVARRGRMSRGGNSRGSSTSPSISRSRPGSPIWRTAMAAYGNDDLVIYGYSQGAIVANLEKRKLAEQYPAGTDAPDIDFVLSGDPNLPNGGLAGPVPGPLHPDPRLDVQRPRADRHPVRHRRHHPAVRRLGRFPVVSAQPRRRPERGAGLRLRAPVRLDVSLAPDPSTSPPIQSSTATPTTTSSRPQDLPLFAPLRTLGVPESLIDVVEPFFRVIVELGYDRSIPPWEPTPARLIPTLNPATVAGDLVNAIGEGINNAAALIGLPPLLSIPAAPAEITRADVSDQTTMRQQIPTPTRRQRGSRITDADADDNAAAGHRHRRDDNEAADHRHRPDDNETKQATDTDQTTTPTVSTSKPWKRAGRHETPRPVVRGPLGVHGQQIRGRQHSGDADAPTTQTAAADDVATTAGTSSPESRSVGGSPDARSPDGDTDDS